MSVQPGGAIGRLTRCHCGQLALAHTAEQARACLEQPQDGPPPAEGGAATPRDP